MIEEKCICGHKARFHGGPFLRADEYLDGKPKKWVPFSLYPEYCIVGKHLIGNWVLVNV